MIFQFLGRQFLPLWMMFPPLPGVSVEPLGVTAGISPGVPGDGDSVVGDSVAYQSDDLDMTLGTLAQQIRSAVAAETHGGEGLFPLFKETARTWKPHPELMLRQIGLRHDLVISCRLRSVIWQSSQFSSFQTG